MNFRKVRNRNESNRTASFLGFADVGTGRPGWLPGCAIHVCIYVHIYIYCVYVYIHIHKYIYTHIYAYTFIEREMERERERCTYSHPRAQAGGGFLDARDLRRQGCLFVSMLNVHPVSVRRFPSFRTQPLESLSHYLWTKNRFLSNPAPGENLLSGNLVMETGCQRTRELARSCGSAFQCWKESLQHIVVFYFRVEIEVRNILGQAGYLSIYLSIHTYIYIYIHTCVYIYIYVCVYIYMLRERDIDLYIYMFVQREREKRKT